MIFRGTFDHALDAKHRLTVPAKYRHALSGGVVLAAAQEAESDKLRGVAIWPSEAYESFTTAALAGINPLAPEARAMKRFLFNFSHDTELDSAHRVMIPPSLLDYATLDREVVVVGSGECLEVFDRERYSQYKEDFLDRVPDLAARLGHTG